MPIMESQMESQMDTEIKNRIWRGFVDVHCKQLRFVCTVGSMRQFTHRFAVCGLVIR